MTLQEFNGLFNLLLTYYPNTKKISEDIENLSNVYYLGLRELTAMEFRQAISRIVKEHEGDYMPKVPTILKYAGKQKNKIDVDTQIELAKKLLNYAILKYGRYSSITFEDKGINAVIDSAGGWRYICDMTMEKYSTFISFEFPRVYRAYLETGFKTSDVFIGIHDFENGTSNRRIISYSDINIKIEALNKPKIEYQIEIKKQPKIEGIEKLKNKMLIG